MPENLIHHHRQHNTFQTMLLLGSMATVLALAGYLFWGVAGVIVSIASLAIGVLFSQPASAKLVLRLFKARQIHQHEAPELLELFHSICQRAGTGTLPLYYVPSRLPNAFAAGVGRQSVVAVSDGLLRIMTSRELAGVLAHEVAHVINQDVKVLGLADTIARTTSAIARFGLLMIVFSVGTNLLGGSSLSLIGGSLVLILAPLLLTVLQLAISRTREFDADLGAAEITGDPIGLAQALQKLQSLQQKSFLQRIFSPGPKRTQPAMLRTHPPTDERVQRLKELVSSPAIGQPLPMPTDRRVKQNNRRTRVLVPRVKRRPRYHVTNGMWY